MSEVDPQNMFHVLPPPEVCPFTEDDSASHCNGTYGICLANQSIMYDQWAAHTERATRYADGGSADKPDRETAASMAVLAKRDEFRRRLCCSKANFPKCPTYAAAVYKEQAAIARQALEAALTNGLKEMALSVTRGNPTIRNLLLEIYRR